MDTLFLSRFSHLLEPESRGTSGEPAGYTPRLPEPEVPQVVAWTGAARETRTACRPNAPHQQASACRECATFHRCERAA